MKPMRDTLERYPGQFEVTPDLLHVAIPRIEIVDAMEDRGDEQALNEVCLSVAVVADAIDAAAEYARAD